jgi:hypothetical protein
LSKQVAGVFAPMTEEVTEGWSKAHNENIHHFCFSSNIVKAMKLKSRTWAFM